MIHGQKNIKLYFFNLTDVILQIFLHIGKCKMSQIITTLLIPRLCPTESWY